MESLPLKEMSTNGWMFMFAVQFTPTFLFVVFCSSSEAQVIPTHRIRGDLLSVVANTTFQSPLVLMANGIVFGEERITWVYGLLKCINFVRDKLFTPNTHKCNSRVLRRRKKETISRWGWVLKSLPTTQKDGIRKLWVKNKFLVSYKSTVPRIRVASNVDLQIVFMQK